LPIPLQIIVLSAFEDEEKIHVLAENTLTKKTFRDEVPKEDLPKTIDELLKL
jgi:hypothetical protein